MPIQFSDKDVMTLAEICSLALPMINMTSFKDDEEKRDVCTMICQLMCIRANRVNVGNGDDLEFGNEEKAG